MGFDDESRKPVWAIWVSPERARTGLSARATRLEIGPVVDVLSVEHCSSGRYLLSRVRASRVLPSRVDCNEFAFSGQNGVI